MENSIIEDETKPTVHALLLSFPVPSHLGPLLQLARRLASFSPSTCNFIFTSIVSYHTVSTGQISQGHADHADGFVLRTIAVPDGLPSSNPRFHILDVIQASNNMKAPTLRFIPQLQHTHPPLSCIISDVFVEWAPDLAASFGLPLFSFFTSNASSCCVMSHAPSLLSHGIIPFQDSSRLEPITCPGAPPLRPKEFPYSMQLLDTSHPHLQFTLKLFTRLEESAGLILNTCYEFEPDAVKAIQTRCPVYTVGPLFLPIGGVENPSEQDRAGLAPIKDNECLTWLDTQAPTSVLYVSFGTLSSFSIEQMKEIALGLEDSEQPFLWVIRKNAVTGSLSDVLPDGFLERTKDRCFITSWAPQLDVLLHRSVGGFFSHCGWNSILENIALNGVPMICWPDKAEQGINARILVDLWKVGLEFKAGMQRSINRGEVEAAIKVLMHGEEGQEMRKRGAELKEEVEKFIKRGGSSFSNMEALVMALKTKA